MAATRIEVKGVKSPPNRVPTTAGWLENVMVLGLAGNVGKLPEMMVDLRVRDWVIDL